MGNYMLKTRMQKDIKAHGLDTVREKYFDVVNRIPKYATDHLVREMWLDNVIDVTRDVPTDYSDLISKLSEGLPRTEDELEQLFQMRKNKCDYARYYDFLEKEYVEYELLFGDYFQTNGEVNDLGYDSISIPVKVTVGCNLCHKLPSDETKLVRVLFTQDGLYLEQEGRLYWWEQLSGYMGKAIYNNLDGGELDWVHGTLQHLAESIGKQE